MTNILLAGPVKMHAKGAGMTTTEPQFSVGDRVFSHYVSNPARGISGWGSIEEVGETRRGDTHGVTGSRLPDTTWYQVRLDEGGIELLDDAHGDWDMARIVPPNIASRFGYGADPRACEACGRVRVDDPDFCPACLADMATKRDADPKETS